VRTKASDKPSAFGTILFAAAAFLFATIIVGAFADIWLPEATGEPEILWEARDHRNSQVMWLAVAGGLAGAVFTGWAWRSPAPTRFKCCFWAGVGLLCLSLGYVCHIVRITAAGNERYDVWIAPLLSTFTVALGLVLIVTALVLDRASARG
jgi:hypothetical protein